MLTLIAVGLALAAGVAAGRAPRPWSWLILVGVAALVVGVLLLPVAAAGLGGEALPVMAGTVGAWATGLLLVGVLVWWLAARGRAWWAGAIGLVGALVLVNAVAILHVAQLVSAMSAPRDRAWLWYWAAVLPADFDLGGRNGLGLYFVQDVLEQLPVLLTAVTAFVVVAVHRSARPAPVPR